jgi:hypothetical protein
MLARAPSYATYVRERPSWALLILFGRLNWARWIERKLRARKLFSSNLPHSDDIGSPEATIIAKRMRTDGVCEEFALEPETLAQIRAFADANPCSARDDKQPFLAKDFADKNKDRRKDILAAYYFSDVTKCPAIVRLMSDPRLLCIARNYLGQDTKNIRTRLWWSFPARRYDDADLRSVAQDRFHFDLNDWRTIKFFFYITEVDEMGGPHIYVRGSHRAKALRHQYSILLGKEKAELEAIYGAAMFRTIVGAAGSGFSEDPFVFHTGATVRTNPRLILELEFGLDDPSPSYRYGDLG